MQKQETTIDHLGLTVRDWKASRRFFTAAMAPLGFEESGADARARSSSYGPLYVAEGRAPSAAHLAFRVGTRAQVDAFHRAALEAGGKDNGGPGVRTAYGPTYYAAFALDPDGNNVEAVCLAP